MYSMWTYMRRGIISMITCCCGAVFDSWDWFKKHVKTVHGSNYWKMWIR